jgi:hypothetical protein
VIVGNEGAETPFPAVAGVRYGLGDGHEPAGREGPSAVRQDHVRYVPFLTVYVQRHREPSASEVRMLLTVLSSTRCDFRSPQR